MKHDQKRVARSNPQTRPVNFPSKPMSMLQDACHLKTGRFLSKVIQDDLLPCLHLAYGGHFISNSEGHLTSVNATYTPPKSLAVRDSELVKELVLQFQSSRLLQVRV